MVSEPSNSQDKNALLFLLASISPSVQESIELESYRLNATSDESTEEHVMDDVFRNLTKDINAIGLTFDIDSSDYTDDMNKLSQLVQLLSLLLPNSLYEVIKTDARVREVIEQILKGSLGDGGTVIQVYLSELGGLDGHLPLRENLVDYIDQIYPLVTQTDVFTDYLSNLIDLHHQERPALIADGERHEQYRDVIRNIIGLMSDAVNLFDRDPDYGQLTTIQDYVIRDFVAPDNFISYAYLFLEDKSDLPVELHNGFDNKWYHYKVSNPWCYEYYPLRKRTITRPYQVIIACVTYALTVSVDEYNASMSAFRKAYPDQQVDDMIASLRAE